MIEGQGRSTKKLPTAAAAIAVAALFAPACGSPTICNCPSGTGITTVAVPAAQSIPITGASADQPCSASVDSAGDGVDVHAPSARTCHVLVRLANGDAYAFSVEFRNQTLAGACGCVRAYATDASPPELVDAGAGG